MASGAYAKTRTTRIACVIAVTAIGLLATGPVGPAAADPSPGPSGAKSPSSPSAASAPPTIDSPGSFAFALLRRGGMPTTGSNVCAVLAWETAEGGQFVSGASQYNPLNTTKPMPGDSIFNSVGVRNYPDWATGLEATWLTIEAGFYDQIRASLQRGSDAIGVLNAITASPWGTKFADPAGALSGCEGWAGEFDRRRIEVQAQIDSATAAVATEQAAVGAAQGRQRGVDARYQQMAAEIGTAKRHIGQFARELYMSGMEPALASGVDAMTSGDPFEYELLRAFPSYVGDRQAQAVTRSLTLLSEVAASRTRADQEVAAATARTQVAAEALAKARLTLAEIETNAGETID